MQALQGGLLLLHLLLPLGTGRGQSKHARLLGLRLLHPGFLPLDQVFKPVLDPFRLVVLRLDLRRESGAVLGLQGGGFKQGGLLGLGLQGAILQGVGLNLCVCAGLAGTGKRLGRSAVERLEHHDFPGNVRELKNLMRRAALLCDGPIVESEHLAIRARPVAVPVPEALLPLEEVERRYLRWARDHHGGDRASLATALGVSERTLYRKLASLDGP